MFRIGLFTAPTVHPRESRVTISSLVARLRWWLPWSLWGGCKTFYKRLFLTCVDLFSWSHRRGMSARSRCSYIGLVCSSIAWCDWFNQCVIRYHYLVPQDWYERQLRVSVESKSVRWRALCVVWWCVMHCTVGLCGYYSSPAHCSSLSRPGVVRISMASFKALSR